MKTAISAVVAVLLTTNAYAVTELVMQEGATIEARKGNRSVIVTAGKGFDRTYEWDRCKLKSDMGARKQRWYGSMGIYDAAPSSGLSIGGCSGISRTVVEEGQIHFDDLQFAKKWIERRPKSYKTVWTNDGLLVSWNVVPGRRQLNVDVWLMCINGKRPKQLDGANDSTVTVLPTSTGKSIHECAQVGQDVIDQTRSQLEEDWKKIDGWIAKDKEYRDRRPVPNK
ncbi:hypothetical protein [Ferribacterium limneticum]|uniref:hypothetical protein n=1 Tax=Ferribacterium limneticum TaxID=76259 RepID=UPI001CF8ED60|nr:hypothetical protein [Ferribacterium limneticum]UCV26830.1 hypothetical protein KI617_10970 [Ferribacterium limneticum]UCV30747.1 hypothetical protein KI608_10970 [Ferribacterium limneticum]